MDRIVELVVIWGTVLIVVVAEFALISAMVTLTQIH